MSQAEENYRNADTLRKQLEVELRQVVVRLEQTEATALREGKKAAEKLQNRVSMFSIEGFFVFALSAALTLCYVQFILSRRRLHTNCWIKTKSRKSN